MLRFRQDFFTIFFKSKCREFTLKQRQKVYIYHVQLYIAKANPLWYNTEKHSRRIKYVKLWLYKIYDCQGLEATAGGEKVLRPQQIKIISRFYAYGMSGALLDWIKNGMVKEPDEAVAILEDLLSG